MNRFAPDQLALTDSGTLSLDARIMKVWLHAGSESKGLLRSQRIVQFEVKEKAMSTVKIFRILFVVATLGSSFVTSFASAELMDCSGSKVSKERSSYEVISPGDRPDRQLRQYIRVDLIASKWPEIDGTEQTVFVHEDIVGNTGHHSGYGDFVLKNGEKLWYKFDGVSSVVRDGSTWEAQYQGVFHFIAGTGRYKAVRGSAHYHGKATPAGLTEDFVCSAVY